MTTIGKLWTSRRTIATASVMLAVVASAAAATAPDSSGSVRSATAVSQVPSGWWRGSISMSERWTIPGDGGERGEVTIRIDRTQFSTARYEVRYTHEYDYGGCRPYRRTVSSWAETRPIDVQTYRAASGGLAFRVYPRDARRQSINFPVTYTEYAFDPAGCTAVKDTGARELRMQWMNFTTKEPLTAKTRRGSQLIRMPLPSGGRPEAFTAGLYFIPSRAGAQGTTEISWNLTFVPSTKAPGPTTPSGGVQVSAPKFYPLYKTRWVGVSVKVTQGGRPVAQLPFTPLCRARIVGDSAWKPQTDDGSYFGSEAFCSFRINPIKHKGKTIRGSITVMFNKREYTRFFSGKI